MGRRFLECSNGTGDDHKFLCTCRTTLRMVVIWESLGHCLEFRVLLKKFGVLSICQTDSLHLDLHQTIFPRVFPHHFAILV